MYHGMQSRCLSELLSIFVGTGRLSCVDRQSSRCICVRPVAEDSRRLHCQAAKWCVLAIETYLVVLRIAASLAADLAADEAAVRCECA